MGGQMNVYEVIGREDDPVYNLLTNLQENDEIQIDELRIRKTDKFYEVENDDLHEGFKTIERCYEFISSNVF
ncbi:alpha/beta superfamily hydrolase [Lysinibacillus composti]|uniref:Uncharacterized protein n=1 Tax=Lysinibacillus composti TaxID=720633 RepID=A0A3N9UIQ8_9BACI|nr:hypothetical protein [Lysinibacillus composti]MBM7607556.1 alpha/beta superfamily hydrolase [Lysinibacillus composti]RQW75939.1 hypothetical protein EBB45_04795 [Lysinibacillus composti]